jgi:hypothetical protein
MSHTPEVESLLALRDLRAEYIVSDQPIVAPPPFADVSSNARSSARSASIR